MDPVTLLPQIFNGLVQGTFYALLSLGLAIIFGVLRVVNFAHGAFFMLGAFGAYILSQQFSVPFWPALILAPVLVGLFGMVLERTVIRRLYKLDPLYNFLLTFGITLILQDAMRLRFGMQGQPYAPPRELAGATNLGFFFYPNYRLFAMLFAIAVCLGVWYLIERTRVGMIVRASTEKPDLTRALGVNVDRWVTPVFGFGVGLAALGGVLAAPMQSVYPLMGAELIITVFAVVVIGGLGSIVGAMVAGLLVGVVFGIGLAIVPPLANTLVFILMAVVLLVRPAGLFGSVEAA
ncbi:MAG: branched-chain amino acid ABC transporter permease [Chloroflexi bacterium]|nr:branched-chain amino acid ABC transporter permease [Chloroflexota bacterium]